MQTTVAEKKMLFFILNKQNFSFNFFCVIMFHKKLWTNHEFIFDWYKVFS